MDSLTHHTAEGGPRDPLETLTQLLRRPGGAELTELMIATGWEARWVRGALFGALKRQRGLTVLSQKTRAGRRYRLAEQR